MISAEVPHISSDIHRKARLDKFAEYVSELPWFNSYVLHKLYINVFNPGDSFNLRSLTCADLLLSPAVVTTGYNLFAFEPQIQSELRAKMAGRKEERKRIAEFLLAFTIDCRKHFPSPKYLESFRLQANLILNPSVEAERITHHIMNRINSSRTVQQKKKSVDYFIEVLETEQNTGHKELLKLLKGFQQYDKNSDEVPDDWKNIIDVTQTGSNSISIKIERDVREKILKTIAGNQQATTGLFHARDTQFYIEPGMDKDFLVEYIHQYLNNNDDTFEITENQFDAQYTLRWESQHMVICRNDGHLTPVTSIDISYADTLQQAVEIFSHLAEWERLLHMEDGISTFKNIEFKLFQPRQEGEIKELEVADDKTEFEYNRRTEGNYGTFIRAELINDEAVPIHYALFYFTYRGEATCISRNTSPISPGQVWEVLGSGGFDLALDPYINGSDLSYIDTYFKLFIDTKPIEYTTLELSPLPAPEMKPEYWERRRHLTEDQSQSA